MHAVVTIAERGRIGGFVWLGIAAAIGALAKYNLFLMLAAVLLAAFSVPSIRTRLFTPRLAVSFAILALLTAPHFWWAVQHLGETTQRLEKLDRENPAFTALDLPFLGIDGVLDLALAIAAWGGPLLAVWFALRHLSRKEDSAPAATDEKRVGDFGRLFGRTAMIGLGVFAGIVLFGDLHSVQERYLTPVLMPLPFWLAFSWPLEMRPRASLRFIGAGAVIAGLMVTAWPLWIVFGREQFAYPYAAVAEALAGAIPGPFTVLAPHDKFGANIAIRLDRAKRWEGGPPPDQVVILWEPKNGRTPRGLIARLGDGFEPRSDVMTLNYPYENLSGQEAQLNAQLYARKP
jgi:4-amino-4-deoxy-L-arabinose transferase-like glycosyltransferase